MQIQNDIFLDNYLLYIFVDNSLSGFLDADTFEEGKLLKSHVFPSLNVLSQEKVAA